MYAEGQEDHDGDDVTSYHGFVIDAYGIFRRVPAGGAHLLITQSTFGIAASWVVVIQDSFGKVGQMFYNFSQATLRPEIAGFAMALSSISVVLNSMLLKRYVPPMEKIVAQEEESVIDVTSKITTT